MANSQKILREGVTEPIEFQLLDVAPITDEGTPVNLAGVTLIDMRIRSEDKGTSFNYDTTNDPARLSISDSANGKVLFTPLGTEFNHAEYWYDVYFLVTDASGAIVPYPSEGHFELHIIEAF